MRALSCGLRCADRGLSNALLQGQAVQLDVAAEEQLSALTKHTTGRQRTAGEETAALRSVAPRSRVVQHDAGQGYGVLTSCAQTASSATTRRCSAHHSGQWRERGSERSEGDERGCGGKRSDS